MTAFTNYAENQLIDWLFRGAADPALPASWHLALFTTIPDDAGGGAFEVDGGSYARIPAVRSLAAFAGTQGLGTTAASSGTSATTSNNISLLFPAPSADWGTIRAIGLYDAAIGGNLWFANALTLARLVRAGDAPPNFAPGAFSFILDAG